MADIRKETMGQLRALRRRIDPVLLQRVRDAVYRNDAAQKQPSEKENARAAVAGFLQGLDDGGVFRARLETELAKQGKKLETLLPQTGAETPPDGRADAPRRVRADPETLLSAPLTRKKTAEKPKSFWRRFF